MAASMYQNTIKIQWKLDDLFLAELWKIPINKLGNIEANKWKRSYI